MSTNLHICSKLFFAAPFPINLTFLLSWGMWRKLNSLFSTSSWHSLRFIFTHMKCFDSFFKCTNPSSSSWKVHLEIYTPIFLYKEYSGFWRLALYTPPRTFFSSRIKFLYHFKKKTFMKIVNLVNLLTNERCCHIHGVLQNADFHSSFHCITNE